MIMFWERDVKNDPNLKNQPNKPRLEKKREDNNFFWIFQNE